MLDLIASEPPFATSTCKFLLDLPTSSETVTADFAKRQVHLPSLCDFLFSNANVEELRQSEIYQKFNAGIVKIANGSYLFDDSLSDSDLVDLASHMKSHMFLIATNV